MRSKLLINLALFLCIFVRVERFCHQQTEGFRLGNITSSLPYEQTWDLSPPDNQQEIAQILSQPFRFLGSGGQSYAFLSADGETVLKFFKHHHMRPDSYLNSSKKQQKLSYVFGSCKIAYEEFKEETGLLYVHLNPSDYLHQKITLIDKIGIAHTLDLDQTTFILQKRGILLYDHLSTLNDDQAKQCLDSLVDLLIKRCERGIADKDPNIKRNFACLGQRVIDIDLGNFSKNPALKDPIIYKKEIAGEMKNLKGWLEKRRPELSDHLTKRIASLD